MVQSEISVISREGKGIFSVQNAPGHVLIVLPEEKWDNHEY